MRSLLLPAVALAALASLLAVPGAPAGASVIVSTPGGGSCSLGAGSGLSGACNLQAITPHELWQPADPGGNGALWVSYSDTGVDGTVLAPPRGAASNPDGRQPIMSVSEALVVSPGGGRLLLDIWADDTADVYLDGLRLIAANFSQNICADGIIGCQPGENGTVDRLLAAGPHTLRFDVYQVGSGSTPDSNPFGLMYSGWLSGSVTSGIAEPATVLLLGAALGGLGWLARHRRHALRRASR